MEIFSACLFLLLAAGGIVVWRTYAYIPRRELKRKAEQQDPLAMQLYRAVAYGSSLRALLAACIAVCASIGAILLARSAAPIVSFFVLAGFGMLYILLPSTSVTKFDAHITARVTPTISAVLNYLYPILQRTLGVLERRFKAPAHTGLYERDDLLRVIDQQQHQTDSRFSDEELAIARRALSFADYAVSDVYTPRKQVASVLATDTLGPILIDELHKSGQDFVLVRESKKGPFVGSLEVARLGLQTTGLASEFMHATVYYLHAQDTLQDALHAFFMTNHPLFVVVDDEADFIGILTIEQILRQLLGHVPGEAFDQYTNPVAVAGRRTTKIEPAPAADAEAQTDTVKTGEKVVE